MSNCTDTNAVAIPVDGIIPAGNSMTLEIYPFSTTCFLSSPSLPPLKSIPIGTKKSAFPSFFKCAIACLIARLSDSKTSAKTTFLEFIPIRYSGEYLALNGASIIILSYLPSISNGFCNESPHLIAPILFPLRIDITAAIPIVCTERSCINTIPFPSATSFIERPEPQ